MMVSPISCSCIMNVSSQISVSNETLASGYRDSGYVRSEASSLEEDDSKASKDLVEELKFKDVLICELQESNRGLRMRCADAENKIFRLRIKCQSHCACCQAGEVAQSLSDSAGEDKDESSSSTSGKYHFLSHDLFHFKRNLSSSSSNNLNLSSNHGRLTIPRDSLANSYSTRGNRSLPDSSLKQLTRSNSSGTIGTQTSGHHSSRRAGDQAAEKLFALKVQQWQKEHYLLKNSPSDERVTFSSPKAADLSSKRALPQSRSAHTSLPHRTSKLDGYLNKFEIANGEASHLSAISERDSSLEVDSRRTLNPDVPLASSSMQIAAEEFLKNPLPPPSIPFADITNQRVASVYEAKCLSQKALDSQDHLHAPPHNLDDGFLVDGFSKSPKDPRCAEIPWANANMPESVSCSASAGCHFASNAEHFAAREQPCRHCNVQPPVIIVPAGCCSCCRNPYNRLDQTQSNKQQHDCEVSPKTPENHDQSRVKIDVCTDSSDLHPLFEMKSKPSPSEGKFDSSATSGSDPKFGHQSFCKFTSCDHDCRCSPTCSGLTVPLATKFDSKADYKRKIEEGMKKIALDARAETQSLSFQPWTSPDSPEMSPLLKRLAESSYYVNQMAITINRITSRFAPVPGTSNLLNPSP